MLVTGCPYKCAVSPKLLMGSPASPVNGPDSPDGGRGDELDSRGEVAGSLGDEEEYGEDEFL